MKEKRSLPLGIHFDVPKENTPKKEMGHSIDQENYEPNKDSIALEDNTVVVFPT